MNSDFPRILTLLRKEKGISQKQAAQDLEVSQALLSHYEKGIRECGLAFVVRAADYYNVSCDFLLGRSPERRGTTLSVEELPEPEEKKELPNPKTLAAIYNKKLIFSSLNILFDILAKSGNKNLINETSSFLTLSVYRMFRILFRANKRNNEEMFRLPKATANARAQAAMVVHEANAQAIVDHSLPKELGSIQAPERMAISMELLENKYAGDKSALLNLIKNCEHKMGADQ